MGFGPYCIGSRMSTIPPVGEPCPACSVEARVLALNARFVCTHMDLLCDEFTPERLKALALRIKSLRQAVDDFQPRVESHFIDPFHARKSKPQHNHADVL